MDALSVFELTKSYPVRNNSDFFAVRNLSFTAREGETIAFLGPNGAGKSTTIKILCGILTPTSGQVKIFGHQAGSVEGNRRLGLVFGTRSQLHLHMTIKESLELCAEIYFVSGKQKHHRIQELAEMFDIQHHLNSRARTLSLGERMRCEIVAALIHKPQILLADEPTIGLDIVAKNKLRELILQWQKEERTTVLLTSHDLSDVEALCQRCILIDHGQKQYDGPLAELKGPLKSLRRVRVTLSDAHLSLLDLSGGPTNNIIKKSIESNFIHNYEFDTVKHPLAESINNIIRHYGDNIQDLQIQEVSLEEVLRQRFS